jgi:uncharacterized protein
MYHQVCIGSVSPTKQAILAGKKSLNNKIKIMKKQWILWALALLLCGRLAAQVPTNNYDNAVVVRGMPHQGTIRLRWIPNNYLAFINGNQYGYQVQRQLVSRNGVLVSNSEQIASTTILDTLRPIPRYDWDVIMDTNDIAGVAHMSIYAEDFVVGTTGGNFFYESLSKSEQANDRYGFGLFAADQSFEVAGFMGLALIDSSAVQEPNGEYLYRVTVLSPDIPKRARGAGMLGMNTMNAMPTPTDLTAKSGKKAVLFTLPRGSLDEYYTSFNLERSVDNGVTWVRRNKSPLLFLETDENKDALIFNDTLESQDTVYLYRMRGKSPFGVACPPSNTVEVQAQIPPLGIYPDIIEVVEINGGFDLTWTFPDSSNSSITGFKILRSVDAEGGFVELGSVGNTVRTFNDPSPSPLVNYYKVSAIDVHEYPNASNAKLGQMNDTQAPVVPTGLSGVADKNGLVTLTWNKNVEVDLKGYRVFYANSPNDLFTQITTVILEDNTFKHQLQLNVIAKKIYYKILATDFRENDSEFSPVIFVDRPDVIAPEKPILTHADPLPLGVHLQWIKSGSDDLDFHELQRKKKNEIAWETLKKFPLASTDTMYMDSLVTGTGAFSYRVIAVDQGGLAAASTSIDVKPLRTNPDTIYHLKAASAVEGVQKQAKLTWEYPNPETVLEFHVYRGMDSGEPHLYKSVPISVEDLDIHPVSRRGLFIFRDKEINPNAQYKYRVVAHFPDGSASPLSKIITFEY